MENLEEQCLEKLNNILFKFDLKVETFHIASNIWYRLVDNSLSKNTYSDWLGLWISIPNMLMHSNSNSIFECLNSYSYHRYSEAYNAIKYLENICCIEEFIIKCNLIGI